ncbi:MAG TPA: NAD(P)/FAD-dependent oxidoreductase [Flavipsychrobacter sp.]|nr:NAD(P)/FAD-dependent oxidoreductase [Flavipsychrobacter sp.]
MSSYTYDVVIAGSGLGGLLSAVFLAKEGMKVCVLEKDKQIGGCLQTFSVQKKIFDSCVHYIGGLGEGHTLWSIFKYAGIADKLILRAYDENGFDRIALGDNEILYPQAIGANNFVEQLLPYFPKEKEALRGYIQLIQEVGDHFPLYRLRNGDASEKALVSSWEVTKTLQQITDNKLLQQVLAGNNLLYAGVAARTPFYIHALVLESYMHNAHKVMPGSSQIAKLLGQELQRHGGEVHRNTEVKKLVEENGIIAYAENNNGRRYYAKHFIANMHPAVLLSITDSNMLRPVYRNRINRLEQTISTFMLNAVLRPASVPFHNYNIYWNASDNVWDAVNYMKDQWPANYALFYTEDKNNPGYAESISVLSYLHYSEFTKWEHTLNRANSEQDRGAEYNALKEQKAEKLLEKIYRRVPELKGNIIEQSTATPLSYRDYTGTPTGALYGILRDVNKPNETAIATRTKISNLFLTGQNVNMHGVLGVSITAIATCAELIGMEHLLEKIKGDK